MNASSGETWRKLHAADRRSRTSLQKKLLGFEYPLSLQMTTYEFDPDTLTTSAKVIADSVSPDGHRLTTFAVTYNRFIHPEFMTYRQFSRNASSSRAIPIEKTIAQISQHIATPLVWASEQPGMQGGDELTSDDLADAAYTWYTAAQSAINIVEEYLERHPDKSTRMHKSILNRILEPYSRITVIYTATEWDNFFYQRCHPDAQPEIRIPAEMMRDAMAASEPDYISWSEWHLPYITAEDRAMYGDMPEILMGISAARCARVSYLTHDGTRSIPKDLQLFLRLTGAVPPHESPLEHVGYPSMGSTLGNFNGFGQLRHDPDLEYVIGACRSLYTELTG